MTQKIARGVARIALGKTNYVELGNLDARRDWGHARDYVVTMWKMLQLDDPQDFVIATGRTVSLEFFIEQAFQFFGLNYKDYLVVNTNFYRPTDIDIGSANPSKANDLLDWRAKVTIESVIENMCIAAKV